MARSGDFVRLAGLDKWIYKGGNVIVTHQNGRIDASFVQHLIVADYFRNFGKDPRFQIVLILTHQSVQHWISIANSLGWNLTAAREDKKVLVVDLLGERFGRLRLKDLTPEGSTFKNPLDKYLEDDKEGAVAGLRRLIVIEDLSSLLCYEGASERTLLSSVWTLKNRICRQASEGQGQSCVLVGVTSTKDWAEDVVGNRLTKIMCHLLADLTIEISPLSTGFSPQISGYLTVSCRISEQDKWTRTSHFKREERTVEVFPMS